MAIEASSINGRVVLEGTTLTISRESAAARRLVGAGEKTLALSAITGVEFVPAGRWRAGYIQFTLPGAVERRVPPGDRIMEAARDENAVTFKRREQDQFEVLRDAVRAALATR